MALGVSVRAAPGACAAASGRVGSFLRHDSSAGSAPTACGRPCACASESAAGPGSRGARPDATGAGPPVGADIRRARMPDPDGGGRRASPGSEKAAQRRRESLTAVAATHAHYHVLRRRFGIPLLDECTEHLSTFTTFKAQNGMTIQGFSDVQSRFRS